MNPARVLELASQLVHEVLHSGHAADRAVSAFFRQHRELGPRERHALAETAYAVLRRRPQLEHLARGGSGPLARRLALLAWQGGAASLQPLLQALSPAERDWHARAGAVDRSRLPDPLRHNLPEWVATPLREELGEEDFWAFVQAMDVPAPLDLRVNLLRARREQAAASLREAGVQAEPTPHSPWGLRVEGKPALTRLAAFERGEVEVQDEGSQLVALLTGAGRGQMVVDFCAGAGGKTLALGPMMRNTGRLYAVDTSGHRLAALRPRLARSGLSNVHPVQIAHERDERMRRLQGKIDAVLVDAPCSGLGTLRRNPDMKWRQSPGSVQELVARQQAILTQAARLLRPGGRLVYATCSVLREENEGVAQAFGAAHAGEFEPLAAGELLAAAGVESARTLERDGCLRLWPHLHATDGFFAAVWRRRGA